MKLERIKSNVFIIRNVPDGARANVVQGKVNAWLKDKGIASRVRVKRGLTNDRLYFAQVKS